MHKTMNVDERQRLIAALRHNVKGGGLTMSRDTTFTDTVDANEESNAETNRMVDVIKSVPTHY